MMRKSLFMLPILFCVLVGCKPNQPVRDCPLETLFLDESAFPPTVALERIYSPTSESRESGTRTFLWGNDSGIQGVFRFSYPRSAYRFYKQKIETFFEEDDVSIPSLYFDDHADHYFAACGVERDQYMCTMIAQYEEYFVALSADISETGLTTTEFVNLSETIDNKMWTCIGK